MVKPKLFRGNVAQMSHHNESSCQKSIEKSGMSQKGKEDFCLKIFESHTLYKIVTKDVPFLGERILIRMVNCLDPLVQKPQYFSDFLYDRFLPQNLNYLPKIYSNLNIAFNVFKFPVPHSKWSSERQFIAIKNR